MPKKCHVLFKWPLIPKIYSYFPGPYAEYLRDNFEQINDDYILDLKFRPECVDLKLRGGPNLVLSHDDPLEVDKKYRIFFKTDVEMDPRNPDMSGKTTFSLTRIEKAEVAIRPASSGERLIKSFIR